MIVKMLVIAMKMFVLVFALRYVGFSSEQTLVLAVAIWAVGEIK